MNARRRCGPSALGWGRSICSLWFTAVIVELVMVCRSVSRPASGRFAVNQWTQLTLTRRGLPRRPIPLGGLAALRRGSPRSSIARSRIKARMFRMYLRCASPCVFRKPSTSSSGIGERSSVTCSRSEATTRPAVGIGFRSSNSRYCHPCGWASLRRPPGWLAGRSVVL